MNKYKCYIIDDEPLAIQVLERHIEHLNNFEVVGTNTNPLKGFSELQTKKVDLLFIDIEMPELSGLELIEALTKRPEVVLTTAHREFAVEGFELNVMDYLVKPIPLSRFLKTIEKFSKILSIKPKVHQNKYIYIQADRKKVKIYFNHVLFLEGVKDYVKIVSNNQKLMTKSSIGVFYENLPKDQFCRIHKSYVVNLQHIDAFSTKHVEIGKTSLPIGRSYKAAFLKCVS